MSNWPPSSTRILLWNGDTLNRANMIFVFVAISACNVCSAGGTGVYPLHERAMVNDVVDVVVVLPRRSREAAEWSVISDDEEHLSSMGTRPVSAEPSVQRLAVRFRNVGTYCVLLLLYDEQGNVTDVLRGEIVINELPVWYKDKGVVGIVLGAGIALMGFVVQDWWKAWRERRREAVGVRAIVRARLWDVRRAIDSGAEARAISAEMGWKDDLRTLSVMHACGLDELLREVEAIVRDVGIGVTDRGEAIKCIDAAISRCKR